MPVRTTSSTWAAFNSPAARRGPQAQRNQLSHAEGYPAAEMKHGPIAFVDENTPSVFIMPQGYVYDKVMSNLEEIQHVADQ